VLFQPDIHEPYEEYRGLQHLVQKCLQGCELDMQRDLLNNVVPVGGTTCFRNFRPALKAHLKTVLPSRAQVNIVDPEDPVVCAWQGGALLTELSTFEGQWVSRATYEEQGPAAVHKACLAA
jgi:actin-related protein